MFTGELLKSGCILQRAFVDFVNCRSFYSFWRTCLQWTLRWSWRWCQDRFWNIINHTRGFGRLKRSTRTICRWKSWWTLWKTCKFFNILTDYKWIYLLSKLDFTTILFENRKVIGFASTILHNWLKKRLVPLFHPIKSKTKTNCD